MANKKRILIVTQEMKPYTSLTQISDLVNQYAQFLQDNNYEVRILMPKFGVINERRHRLHEVVRLSGMNINVNGDDYPLVIKVASLPGTRMQVYFLDNEEYFKRKFLFANAEGEAFEDNAERMIFFCKSVVETVKKFGWAPDIIHAHGWMTSLLPGLLNTTFKEEPIFKDSKMVFSAYNNDQHSTDISATFEAKLAENGLEHLATDFSNGDSIDLNKGAIAHANAVVNGGEDVNIVAENTMLLAYQEEFDEVFTQFYEDLLV